MDIGRTGKSTQRHGPGGVAHTGVRVRPRPRCCTLTTTCRAIWSEPTKVVKPCTEPLDFLGGRREAFISGRSPRRRGARHVDEGKRYGDTARPARWPLLLA